MTNKINSILIDGFRGIKSQLKLELNNKSILIYGENGTGKSSISDAVEWFYFDRVEHLAGAEIDLKEALRNSSLQGNDISSVKMKFNKGEFDCEKKLLSKRGKFVSEFANSSDEFNNYLLSSNNENLILRYRSLSGFIEKTKTKKLEYLSDVIGFSEVIKTKEVLRKAFSSVKSEIYSQNFENQKNTQKQILIDKLGAAISLEKQLFDKIKELIEPFKIDFVIKSFSDIDNVLIHLNKPVDNILLKELQFLEKCKEILTNLKNETHLIEDAYDEYYSEFNKVAEDVQAIMLTFLGDLLKTGELVLNKKYHKDDTCPLCLQPKNLDELKTEIKARLEEIEKISTKKVSFDNSKRSVLDIVSERLRRIEAFESDEFISEDFNKNIKITIKKIKSKLTEYQKAGNEKVTSGKKLPDKNELAFSESDFGILSEISIRIKTLNDSLEKNNTTILYSNISAAKDAFLRIKNIEKVSRQLEEQKRSLEIIYNQFIKKLKEGLENFINSFSTSINDFYQFMNPGEQFHEIKIVTIGEDDELNGITIEYDFNGSWTSPPQKYFSESHVNCLGLAFFLASVKAFNKINKFIVLDDVISSFDTTHRKRFADLIFERFSNYQIILLTHEHEWFQYVSQLAKRNNWLIDEIKWSRDIGTHLDSAPKDLREIIEQGLYEGYINTLGNQIRTYLESRLKEICFNLDVKVSFRYNNENEKRMADELLNELKSRINKYSKELKAKIDVVDRVVNSNILGNLLSHDNPFNPSRGDLKAFWTDILELEKLFYCQEETCKKPVSLSNFDNVEKKVRCKCGKTKYDWKK